MDAHVLLIGAKPREFAPVCLFLNERGYATDVSDVAHWESSLGKWQQSVVIDLESVTPAQVASAVSLHLPARPLLIGVVAPIDTQVRRVARFDIQDVVFKPLSPTELYLRLKIGLERRQRFASEASVPLDSRRADSGEAGKRADSKKLKLIQINQREKTVAVRGRMLQLSPKEFELIGLLASDPGRVFTVREIVERVWGYASRASAEDVHEYVHLLRKKIEDDPKKPKIILTARGFGYRVRNLSA